MNTHRFVKPIMQGLTKLHTLLYKKFGGRFLGTFLGNPDEGPTIRIFDITEA